MYKLVETPHLPKSKVRHIIIGEKYRKTLENALIAHDLAPIWLKNNPYVDERLSGHADLSAVQIGKSVILSEYLRPCEQIHILTAIEYVPDPQHAVYPYDAGLNFCIVGDKLFYNPKTANAKLVEKCECKQLIPVKQGYTKCSICVVDENSIITSDKRIAEAAESAGMDALYLSEPFVKLDGFDYGFIGGAIFKISETDLVFTGKIVDTIIESKIESFLSKRNINPIYLTDSQIFDIGSAIPLTENKVEQK